MSWLLVFVALVAAQRLGELAYARRNTSRLLARGAREVGAGHYPLLVSAAPHWPLIGLFVLLQIGRIWVIWTLGPFWTTRIVTLPGAPLVRRGPYRFFRHPNYLVVALEIAVLPLAFDAWEVALIFSLLNAVLLVHRARVETAALAERL
jgi:methyltransferase